MPPSICRALDKGGIDFIEKNGGRGGLCARKTDMDLPGLQFHLLKGADKGRYSVWASGNWRVTFGWSGEDAIDIDLEDYH